jgi:hypothetical protein
MELLKIVLSGMLVFCTLIMSGQGNTKDDTLKNKGMALRFYYQTGTVLPTNDYVKGKNKTNEPLDLYQAVSLQYGWQTFGKKKWHQSYGFPYTGFGLYLVNFFRPKELGTPFGLYTFYNGPIKRWNKLSFNYQTAIGFLFGWQPYDEISNPYQIAIGSKNSVKIDLGLSVNYQFSRFFELDAGLSFTHFSNGSMAMPNYGLNMYGGRLGVKYNLRGQPDFIKVDLPKYKSNSEWLVGILMAVKQVTPDTSDIENSSKYLGVNYGIFGITTTLNRQISYKSKWGLGFDFIYDASINAQKELASDGKPLEDSQFHQHLTIGVFPSYELVINKISLILQPGFYLYKKQVTGNPDIFYQRIGLKYHFLDNLYLGCNLRAYNFKVADYIEWIVGYSLQKGTKESR